MEDQIFITIAKVLHGEASEADRQALDAWLKAEPGNRDIYEEMKGSWEEAGQLFESPAFDAAPAWEKVAARIEPVRTAARPKSGKTIALGSWIRYGSAIAAILIIAFIVWNPFSGDDIRVIAEGGNKRIELPDHSVVTLRSGSTLIYPKQLAGASRTVALAGEAFFEVTRDESRPFIIDAQAVQVKVLGTSFNVSCSDQAADVAVASGRVQVASKSAMKQRVVLSAGKTAHYEGGALREGAATGSEAFWNSGELFFNDAPLSGVVTAIARAKDTAVRLHESLVPARQGQLVTISFRGQSLEDMLTELCLITNCRWEQSGTEYVIHSR